MCTKAKAGITFVLLILALAGTGKGVPAFGLPVFPGAQGFGTETPAGRGGRIIRVTSLHDAGEGSLRAALEASGARVVVFEVGGTIDLTAVLEITNPYITVAGQTAPSPGITLKGAGIRIDTHDVLIQHLRVRVGDAQGGPPPDERDGIQVLGHSSRVIIDHLSISWAIDENGSTWGNPSQVTFSNCIFSEALHRSLHPKGFHSKGLLIGDHSRQVAAIGNLLAHNVERNALVKGDVTFLFVNNLVYNGGRSTRLGLTDDYSHKPSHITAIGNVFIDGPNTPTPNQPIRIYASAVPGSSIYLKDNMASGVLMACDVPFDPQIQQPTVWDGSLQIIDSFKVEARVLAHAGARPADRDAVDRRIINEVRLRSGRIIDSQNQVEGWENVQSTSRVFVPPPHPSGDNDGDGYTNLEEALQRFAAEVENLQEKPFCPK